MTRTAYISLGSNIGDRHAHLERAVALISRLSSGDIVVSTPIETEPWGFDSPNGFVNMAMSITTTLEAEELLGKLLEIQNSISPDSHRNPDGSYADRKIDIDLIAIDAEVLDTPSLELPHPRMHLRDFVLRPMAEIAPTWVHPLLGQTPSVMLGLL